MQIIKRQARKGRTSGCLGLGTDSWLEMLKETPTYTKWCSPAAWDDMQWKPSLTMVEEFSEKNHLKEGKLYFFKNS